MDCHGGKVAKAFAIGAVGGGYSLLARPIANASYRLVVPSNSEYSVLERANSEYSLFERIRYWSRTAPMKPFLVVKSVFEPPITTQHEQPTTTSPSTASTTSGPATKPRSGSHANESMGTTAGAAVETRIRWIRHHHYRGCNYDQNRPSTATNTTATPTFLATTTAAPPESLPLRQMPCWPGI